MKRPRTVLGSLVAVGMLCGPEVAHACVYPPDRDRFDQSRRAVTARVVSVDLTAGAADPGPDKTRYRATLRVRRVFKGNSKQLIDVKGDYNGPDGDVRVTSDCVGGPLRVGQRIGLLFFDDEVVQPIDLGSFISYASLRRFTGDRYRAPRP